MFKNSPRMLLWCVLTLVLMAVALWVQTAAPGSVLAVTLYKAHLMALGGWGGYWLDRALFPYDRPHQYLEEDLSDFDDGGPYNEPYATSVATLSAFGDSMLRRAIIVAACLVCVGLGA